jgi:hypothetical protein
VESGAHLVLLALELDVPKLAEDGHDAFVHVSQHLGLQLQRKQAVDTEVRY